MGKYEDVRGALLEKINEMLASSEYALPPERALCEMYGVSRQTIRKVLLRLKSEKVLTSRRGSGYTLTGLRPGRPSRIVLLMDDTEAYTRPLMISRITRKLDSLGFEAAVVPGGSTQEEAVALQRILEDPPDGMFIWGTDTALPTPNASLYEALHKAGTRLVFPRGRYPNVSAGFSCPGGDEQAGFDLTAYLTGLGHTRIAMILCGSDAEGEYRRLGYARALWSRGIPVYDRYVSRITPDLARRIRTDQTGRLMRQIARSIPEEITAVICQTDELAFLLIRALEKEGIDVPSQISAAGFDCSHLRTAGRISLTTMRRSPLGEDEYALRAMLSLLGPEIPGDGPVHWELVRGSSCAPPPGIL